MSSDEKQRDPGRVHAVVRLRVGQRVWFLKSMRMCVVVEDHGEVPPHGHCYSIEVMDSGRRLFVPEQGLEAI